MGYLVLGPAVAAIAAALGVAPAAAGDAAAGEKVFKKCKACHSLAAGENKVGPTLAGIIGAPAGTVDGFKYSDSLASSGVLWDDASLDAYLAKPKEFIPGNKMAFPGLKKPEDRANVIEYIKSNGG